MGMPPAEVERLRQEATAATTAAMLEIWPENWRPLLLALAMQSQVITGMQGAVAFNYASLPTVEALIEIQPPESRQEKAEDFAAFRYIERIYFSS